MRENSSASSGPAGWGRLLAATLGGCVAIFLLLELWRPCYFLTDDNLSSLLPMFTEMGRHLRAGQSPFVSHYLFGGNYDLSRDVGVLYWHPFYLLPAMLADTPLRFWILDAVALLFLLLATAGFTILARTLRDEYAPALRDIYLVFYTLSFVFSTYILMTAPSWVNFLGNLSALPWLTLGILDRKVTRGTLLVAIFTIHQLVGAYAQLTLSNVLCLTLFSAGVAICRGSPRPFFNWMAGNLIGLLVLAPFMLHILDGFAMAHRIQGLSLKERSEYFIPVVTFPFSFFLGNWTEPIVRLLGDPSFERLKFPYPSVLLACAASWCVVPAFFAAKRWRPMEIICFGMAILLAIFIMRPPAITAAMYHIPFLKSMRWPFRESMQFLFFVHLFIILRPVERYLRWQPAIVLASLAAFALPLPWVRPPTFNALALDRQLVLSGTAERFWDTVKNQLRPGDEIATIIDWDYWQKNSLDIPYSALGTANFSAFLKVVCVSGYSTTIPLDQYPIKTIPHYWFGAFRPDQVDELLAEKPNLRLVRIKNTHPLTITMSRGDGPEIDLTPYLQAAGFTGPAADSTSPSAH